MLSATPPTTVPISSTEQMYLTYNGEVIRLTLSINIAEPIILVLEK